MELIGFICLLVLMAAILPAVYDSVLPNWPGMAGKIHNTPFFGWHKAPQDE